MESIAAHLAAIVPGNCCMYKKELISGKHMILFIKHDALRVDALGL